MFLLLFPYKEFLDKKIDVKVGEVAAKYRDRKTGLLVHPLLTSLTGELLTGPALECLEFPV